MGLLRSSAVLLAASVAHAQLSPPGSPVCSCMPSAKCQADCSSSRPQLIPMPLKNTPSLELSPVRRLLRSIHLRGVMAQEIGLRRTPKHKLLWLAWPFSRRLTWLQVSISGLCH